MTRDNTLRNPSNTNLNIDCVSSVERDARDDNKPCKIVKIVSPIPKPRVQPNRMIANRPDPI